MNGLEIFLLTRPMRGATFQKLRGLKRDGISTHTPHAGRDESQIKMAEAQENFYSHAPCGARPTRENMAGDPENISTHTPHAGRDKH